jgi:hypothetical protein
LKTSEVGVETFLANDRAYTVLAFAALAIPACVVGIAYFWYKLRQQELITNLKRELSERGMAAEEIRVVVEAAPRGSTDVAQDLVALNGEVVPLAKSRNS